MYIQHEDNDIAIPQHISKKAFYSIQFILLDGLLAIKLCYYRLAITLLCLYITSILHWNKVKYVSMVKIIDIILATGTILQVTYIDSYRFTEYYFNLWNYSVNLCICTFFLNEILFYFQVLSQNNKVLKDHMNCKYYYFSLYYSNPNTEYRELCYKRSAYTHMLFIHIFPTVACAYCAIMSHDSSQYA